MRITNRSIGYITLLVLTLAFTAVTLSYYFKNIRGWCTRIAYADDIGNLKLENPIKVAGMEVGTVRSISRENDQAKVVLKMREAVDIRTNYILLNMDVGLMGDRVLALDPGSADTPLPRNAPLQMRFIKGIAEGIRNADTLKFIITDLSELVGRYAHSDPNNDTLFTTKFRKVLRSLDRSTRKVERFFNAKEADIYRLIVKTRQFSRQTRKTVAAIKPGLRSDLQQVEKLSAQTIEFIDKLDPLIGDLDKIIDMLQDQNRFVGRLIEDKKLYDKLIRTIKKLRSLLSTAKDDGIGLDIDIF